jgi:hypothetical protein
MKINLWVGTQSNPDDRLKLSLSDADRALVDSVDRYSDEHFTGERFAAIFSEEFEKEIIKRANR